MSSAIGSGRTRRVIVLGVLLMPLLSARTVAAGEPGFQLVRFALVAGNNFGGGDVVKLRYAERDARRVADVLRRIGGVRTGNLKLLQARSGRDFLAQLERIERRIAKVKRQENRAITVLMVYFSGHAKDGDLRFGKEKVSLEKIKQLLAGSEADVRIGVLDACRAGEITRLKGGTLAPPFLEVEDELAASGHVLITSSSGNEDSQESDDLGGSFFTHYLLSGLRGAADQTGDGAVTLAEAYQYAYHHTVARTAGSRGGTQHPEYRFDLQGRGDLVLTRVGGKLSRLLFPEALSGDYMVYDLERRVVVAEVSKGAGEERVIAVNPGTYVVKRRRAHDVLIGEVEVPRHGAVEVDEGKLEAMPFEDDYTKGAVALDDPDSRLRVELSPRFGYQGFFDAPVRDELFYNIPMAAISVEIQNILTQGLSLAIDLTLGAGDGKLDTEAGIRVPVDYSQITIGLGVNYRLQFGWFALYLGPRFAFVYMRREFKGATFENWQFQDFGAFSPGAVVGMDATAGDHWRFKLEGRVHYLYYNVEGEANKHLGYGEGFLGVAYVF